METKLKESKPWKSVFILILLFSTGYTPNLQPKRKHIVESARDRQGTTTKTPPTTK
jgi:hypothetical protein